MYEDDILQNKILIQVKLSTDRRGYINETNNINANDNIDETNYINKDIVEDFRKGILFQY